MVEFALILFPLLLIVAGIIQFGIGLNYWLDMQRHREPGSALGRRKQLAARLSRASVGRQRP